MLGDAGIFFYAIALGWLVALLLARRAGGEGSTAPMPWHPAAWLCEAVGPKFWAGLGFCSAAVLASSQGPFWSLAATFVLVPLPYLLVDYSRRDARLRRVKRVFYNPLHAVTSQPVRELSGGRVEERVMKVYFCIDEVEWGTLSQVMGDAVRSYLERRRLAGPIFCSDADNEFLQVYDSLGLSRFLLEPSNAKVMETVVSAFALPSSTPGSAASRPSPLPVDGDGEGDDRIVTAGAALGTEGSGAAYAKASRRQSPSGKARAIPISPPPDLGGSDDAEN
jgi:hypothetical protein